MSWARGLGYPWTVIWDTALDNADTTAIVNGHGVYALSGEKRRRQMLGLKRLERGVCAPRDGVGGGHARHVGFWASRCGVLPSWRRW